MKVFVVERLICEVNEWYTYTWCCRQLLVCTKDVLQCWLDGRTAAGGVGDTVGRSTN